MGQIIYFIQFQLSFKSLRLISQDKFYSSNKCCNILWQKQLIYHLS